MLSNQNFWVGVAVGAVGYHVVKMYKSKKSTS
jgi:hypothetical protein